MSYKILQLISGPGLYGAERMLLELSAYLQDQGQDVHIAVLESDAAPGLTAAARRLDLRCTTLPGELRHPMRLANTLSELVSSLGIQVVHSHSHKADAMQRLATFPETVKRMATCHGRHPTSSKLRLLELVNRPALRLFQHAVAVSPRMLDQLRDSGLPYNHTTLIDNGLDVPPAKSDFSAEGLRGELGVKPDEALLIRACRLVPSKGVDLLLRALARQVARHPVRLVIAGDGPEKSSLEQLASRLGIADRVIFAGYREDVPDLLRAADLMVLSSRDEGLPRSMLEAMALEVPVIAANVGGGIRRLIQPGQNGWLVRREDLDAVSLTMTEALSRPDLRQQYSTDAYALYQQNHTRAAMGQQYLDLYKQLLG